MTEYLLDHQWMFIRHIRLLNPSGSIRCANRLSCRFVYALYNLNCTTAMLKTRLSLCAKVIDWCFCARVFSCSVDNACLVLFRFAGVIVTRCRLFGGGPFREGYPHKYAINLVMFTRGLGKAVKRAIKSSGSKMA
ncbi:MAG: hypothetical protein ACJASL_003169 [Paraglaciecola sp.]|jgi:hypothetical protein